MPATSFVNSSGDWTVEFDDDVQASGNLAAAFVLHWPNQPGPVLPNVAFAVGGNEVIGTSDPTPGGGGGLGTIEYLGGTDLRGLDNALVQPFNFPTNFPNP